MATINGTASKDRLVGGAAGDVINNDLIAGTIGSADDDALYGNGGNDTLNGGNGNDTLNGGVGNDTLDGGAGIDTADYSNGTVITTNTNTSQAFTGATAGVFVNLGLAGAQDTGGAGLDTLVSIENLIGTNANDFLVGSTGDNVLSGQDGADQLTDNNGNDTLNGGAGNDFLAAGSGHDTLNGDENNDNLNGGSGNDTLNGGSGLDQLNGGSDSDTLSGGVDNDQLNGGSGSDTLSGDGGNDILRGGPGTDSDSLNGGEGLDTASYSDATASVVVNLGIGGAQNTGGAGTDRLVSIENLEGSNFGDTLTGDGAGNVLSGLGGSDVLNGGGGDDTLIGGTGNDTLNGGTGKDTASYRNATARVTVNLGIVGAQNTGGAGTDQLASIENLEGSNYGDSLIGDGGDNTLNGGSGADNMNGGAGSDTYIVDNVGDWVWSQVDDGVDLVQSSVSFHLSNIIDEAGIVFEALENLTLTGTAAINGSGTRFSNTITGNSADNRLGGEDGNDRLIGGAGNDTLNGGDDNDTLTGGSGHDQLNGGDGIDTASYSDATAGVTVTLGTTASQDTGGAGIDTLVNIDNLTGSNYGDTLTGNGIRNVLSGFAGNDVINGGGGDDLLLGGLGADTLTGGSENDRFDYDKSTIESPAGLGRDRITDFRGNESSSGDQIDLRDLDANTLATGNQGFSWINNAAFTAAGQLRYAGGVLRGNTDADLAAEFEIQLLGTPALFVNPVSVGTDILL